jgi:predicted site-specific integrase-resolvase
MEEMLSIQKVSKMLGVTVKTLKIWDNEGKLKAHFRTSGGHRRYRHSDIEEFIGTAKVEKNRVFIYCRVSTKKQADCGNLLRQEERLRCYCEEKGYKIVNTFKEVASGVNERRRELTRMLKELTEVNKIVVEYPDRIARFGFIYLEAYANSYGVEIESVEESGKLEPTEEMVKDMLSIVTCFSAKVYGSRGGKKVKKTLEELETERQGVKC